MVHVAQEPSLFPLMTVWDNLLMGGHMLATARSSARARMRSPSGSRCRGAPHRARLWLSGGQQKLIEVARALMLEPRLVLLDEPTMGLDPKARHMLFELVGELNAEGRTVLLVEQNARAGLAIAHHGAVLDGGRVALSGTGRAPARRPAGRRALPRRRPDRRVATATNERHRLARTVRRWLQTL